MRTGFSAMVALVWVGLGVVPFSARGTDSYEYKPGETLIIDHGLSPDKRFAIAAGIRVKGGEHEFHLFLVDAKSKKRIGPLEEVAEPLDTGPESLHAIWAPDSRHVAITCRVDRHETEMVIYRIENQRAFAVTGTLNLMDAIKGAEIFRGVDHTAFFLTPTWLDAKRFTLREESEYHRVSPNPAPVLREYAEVESEEGEGAKDADGKKTFEVSFAADGLCELVAGDKYRLVSIKPVKAGER